MSWEKIRYFEPREFDSPDAPGSGERFMFLPFVMMLDELRDKVGFPLVISSGYRTPEHNAKVSDTGRCGPHTTGRAADILVRGTRAYAVLEAALELHFTGIGIKQKGDMDTRFIHLDTADNPCRPNVWSY